MEALWENPLPPPVKKAGAAVRTMGGAMIM